MKKRFSKDDFNTYLQATGEKLVNTKEGTRVKVSIGSSDILEFDFAAEEKKLQEERNDPPELVHKTVLYLDLETGLTIRREDMSLMKEQSSFSAFQIS